MANDSAFTSLQIRPGDEVFITGFPKGLEANAIGFPILRSGRIASFPLTPADLLGTFLVDFSVFGGNSGGPIFLNQASRAMGAGLGLGQFVAILGLVSSQYTVTATGERLNVASIVYAKFITETIGMLPNLP